MEETETSYSNMESNMVKFTLDRRDIQEIKRIGRKGEKPRPLKVTFSTLSLKIDIFEQKGALKETTYYIKEDYPQNIPNKRK